MKATQSTGAARKGMRKSSEKNSTFATSLSLDSMSQFGREIAQFPLLSREEECELSRRALAGDEEAQHKLVRHNLRFAVSIAQKFTIANLPPQDLISAAYEGMLHAAKLYDASMGPSFVAYAAIWAKQRMLKFLPENAYATRIPAHHSALLHKVIKACARLMQRNGRYPTVDEVAAETNEKRSDVSMVLEFLQPYIELDAPVSEDNDSAGVSAYFGESMDVAGDREDMLLAEIDYKRAIERALAELPPRERVMIKHLFGLDGYQELSTAKVGAKFGLTAERIRQIRADALKKFKEVMDDLRVEA